MHPRPIGRGLLVLALSVVAPLAAAAQTGAIAGRVTDSTNSSGLAGAIVSALSGTSLVDSVITGADGGYRFQSDPPDHIHILVSAEGFEALSTNRYHPEGRPPGRMDILLVPSRS